MSPRARASSPPSQPSQPSQPSPTRPQLRARATPRGRASPPATLLVVEASCARSIARIAQFDALAVACDAEAGVVLAGEVARGTALAPLAALAMLGLASPVAHDPARRLVTALGGTRLPALVRVDADGRAHLLPGACTPRTMASALAATGHGRPTRVPTGAVR